MPSLRRKSKKREEKQQPRLANNAIETTFRSYAVGPYSRPQSRDYLIDFR